jgi:hypothetical protein
MTHYTTNRAEPVCGAERFSFDRLIVLRTGQGHHPPVADAGHCDDCQAIAEYEHRKAQALRYAGIRRRQCDQAPATIRHMHGG